MAIQRVLANPLYAGLVNVPAYKGQPARTVKAIHAPIISANEYWLVREKLIGKNHRKMNREEVPLRGVLKCHCGRYMTAAPSKSKTGKYYWYYFCESHRSKNYSASKLHSQFEEILKALSLDERVAALLKEKLSGRIEKFINEKTKELMKVGLAIQKAQSAIEAVEEKYLLQPDISQNTFKKVMKEKRIQLNELQAQQAALHVDAHVYVDRLNMVVGKIMDLPSLWESLDLPAKHNFIRQGFESNLTYTDGEYRTRFCTHFLHTMS